MPEKELKNASFFEEFHKRNTNYESKNALQEIWSIHECCELRKVRDFE